MYGSGVRTGIRNGMIVAVLRRIRQVLLVGIAACIAAAVGAAFTGNAAHPIAAALGLTPATAISACASPSPSNM